MSFGRYHTPINWWNTAFHHGQWLQTTISRPEMVQFGGRFIPVHFVGALVEGVVPSGGLNINYQAGIGNGRGNVISRAGDAGDNNDVRRASGQCVHQDPTALFGLQVGASAIFRSDHAPSDGPSSTNGSSRATRCGSAKIRRSSPKSPTSGTTQVGTSLTTSSLAYYVQAAYRLPAPAGSGSRTTGSSTSTSTPTIRCSPACRTSTDRRRRALRHLDLRRIKTEGRFRRRVDNQPRDNGWFSQIASRSDGHGWSSSPQTRCCRDALAGIGVGVAGHAWRPDAAATSRSSCIRTSPVDNLTTAELRRLVLGDREFWPAQRARDAADPRAGRARARRRAEEHLPDDGGAVPPALDREGVPRRHGGRAEDRLFDRRWRSIWSIGCPAPSRSSMPHRLARGMRVVKIDGRMPGDKGYTLH